jgi:cytochrome o ubiquinol oxidase operon protein cyoD
MKTKKSNNAQSGHMHTRTYVTGFILAVLLTAIAFSFVLIEGVPKGVAISGILVAAVFQMLVHLHFFLHLDRSSTTRWNILSLVFTVLLLFIFIGGTIWVMFTLNQRMM